MKGILVVICILLSMHINAQLLTWVPQFIKETDNLTITCDANKGNQGLLNYSNVNDVYVHVGVITSLSTSSGDWRYVKFTWATTNSLAQCNSLGNNKWQYTITGGIRNFLNVPNGETILKIAVLFRNGAGTVVQRNLDASDMFVPIYNSNLAARIDVPFMQPTFIRTPEPINKQIGDNISITANASATADVFKLYLNGTIIQTATNANVISAVPLLSQTGNNQIIAEANIGSTFSRDTLNFLVSTINVAPLPVGVKDGINYEAGNTSVVLVLYAPFKNRVSVIGDFPGSNWIEQLNYVMNKTPDGNYWWLRITGLTPGTEYSYQYFVDGSYKVGEPYAEKILDQNNDPNIPAITYPNIKAYPTNLASGIVSLLQTNQPNYNWVNTNFTRPDKRTLVVYELMLRDFIGRHDWQTMRDTLNYLKNLGINAIEVMPITDADYQGGWGYDPAYFFAPDKYFGTKAAFKEFIDSCHGKGIAVIMDMVMNHATGSCPLAQLYWNGAASQPAANNPWFNMVATHPYSVFNDFNHESIATKYFTSRVIDYWLTQYKIDGFRWDLSKGFTQNNTGSNVAAWGAYDLSRINIWKRYYDSMQIKSAGSYCILEHFADNSEETELSNYGMMLWGNMHDVYKQISIGAINNSNPGYGIFNTRGWSNPHLVTYMESHDEERIMVDNLANGSASGSYDIKTLNTALKRIELCYAFLFTQPGPKMLYEFGELGYEYSINTCINGTVNNNCRTDPKPIKWDYVQISTRKKIYDVLSALNKLRVHPLFKANFLSNRSSYNFSGMFKWYQLTTDTSNICMVGNMDVVTQTGSVIFQNAGTWYDYLSGATITATGLAQSITLQPGEYHIYVNRNVVNAINTATTNTTITSNLFNVKFYPNPIQSNSKIEISIPQNGLLLIEVFNMNGQKIKTIYNGYFLKGKHTINENLFLNGKPSGTYIVKATLNNILFSNIKIINP